MCSANNGIQMHVIFLVVLFSLQLQAVTCMTNPLLVKGNKFFDSVTGDYVGVKGVAYYPRPNKGKLNKNNLDFFTDEFSHVWKRDITHLKAAGINAIRIYAVDPTKSHDKFMCALSSAGIYAIIGLAASCENCAIGKEAAPACYSPELRARGQMIISAFAKYKNTLGFSAGNEVNHVVPEKKPETNGPCQKKFIRDMRTFISKCPSMRKIPVGVVLADTSRKLNALYYNCRTDSKDTNENAQWYGLNPYVYCDNKVKEAKGAIGFQNLLKEFKQYKYSIPVMLTEYGCINPSFPAVGEYKAQRTFLQAGWLLSKPFRDVFAGGFVFEYSTELANSQSTSPYPFLEYGPQNFGLGYFSPKDCDDLNVPCKYNRMPNFSNLAKQLNGSQFKDEINSNEYSPKHRLPTTCPPQFKKLSDFTWKSDSDKSLKCPLDTCHFCKGDTETSECNVKKNKEAKARFKEKRRKDAKKAKKSDDKETDQTRKTASSSCTPRLIDLLVCQVIVFLVVSLFSY